MTTLLRTPLYEVQRQAGARFVPFAGWEMPVQFTSILAEHQAVRQHAGVFDVSHMGRLVAQGPGAGAALQALLTNDLGRIAPSRAQYTLLCREDGGILDDLVVYQRAVDHYALVVNAANRQKDLDWLNTRRPGGPPLVDATAEQAMLALQGPQAPQILAAVGGAAACELPRWGCMDLSVAGIACFVARTGYTGEDGFELICAGGQAPALWQALTAAGAWPCGLGARDTLRLEAALPLYGHELSETTNPYEAGLGWAVRLEKGEFIGRAALAAIRAAGPQRRLTGFVMESRAIPRPGFAVEVANEPVGSVTSGGPAPTLGRNIGLAYLPNALSAPGTPINIVIRERREPATTVQTPFYRAAGR